MKRVTLRIVILKDEARTDARKRIVHNAAERLRSHYIVY